MLQDGRMAGVVKLHRSAWTSGPRQVWAVRNSWIDYSGGLKSAALYEFMCCAANGSYTAAEDASAPGVRYKTR